VVIGAQVLDRDPGGLLSVHLDAHGWLSLLTIEPVLRSRLDEHVGTATPDEMAAVEVALGAMLEMG
jgi:mRNA-degrading endonuclease toxin of MazEF toxin-antitoxin module